MKKLTLSLLAMLGLMIISVSIVTAAISGVAFTTPATGANISGTSYLVAWDNNNSWGGLYLNYKQGGCQSANPWINLTGPLGGGTLSYNWDTTGLSGVYCLRLDQVSNETLSGNFTIDNVDPTASLSAGQPYSCNEGDNVSLDASASIDTETGIMSYEWDLDNDGQYDDGTGVMINHTCGNGPDTPTIGLRVTDYAGNTDTDSATVTILNVPPVCNGIIADADAATVESVLFTENATDVVDALTLSYTWDFNDSSGTIGNAVEHTFAAGTYTVKVNVSDGADTCVDTHVITVVDPTPLTNQTVVALTNLTANFTPDEGAAANSFATGLVGGVTCVKRTTDPADLAVAGSGNDCVVTWTDVLNNQTGANTVLVRVNNATDYEYYTFGITAYSYAITLVPGWNLISIPVIPEDTSIQTVLFDQLSSSLVGGFNYSVWSYQYDGSSSKWLKSRTTGYGDLDYIEPGQAYWLNMDSADVLYGFGDKLIAAETPPSKTIVSGWNLVGHYGLLSVSLANALTTLSPHYTTVLDSTGFTPANFNLGGGYWVHTNLKSTEQVQYAPSNESYNFA